MGDLRLVSSSSCYPSGAFLPPFSAGSHKGVDRTNFLKVQQQTGTSRIGFELCRNLSVSSHFHKKFQWKALLDDQRFSFGLHTCEHEPALMEEEDLNVFGRLALAWRILFPKRKKAVSPAEIAKQRLKMILISDRCSVNDNAKRKIVNNIVGALADFVEIESQDRVRLNVSADPDLGTVYSVSVPVRRVRPEYQDNGEDVRDDELREVTASELEEKFDFPEVQDVQGLALGSVKTQDVEVCSTSLELQDVEG